MNTLTPAMKKVILHWGEMGPRWGVNRTVAQIHALLFLSPAPLTADDIVKTLHVARSNVSTSLKELQGWGIVKRVNVMGDRRDQFESLKDAWAVFKQILAERKKRELDPTVALLKECAEEAGKEPALQKQLKDMLDYFQAGQGCLEEVSKLSPQTIRKLAKLGGGMTKTLAALTG